MKRLNKVTTNDIKEILRMFISENFLASAGLDQFKDTDSFMDKGIIDSTGVLELVSFIEDRFKIIVEDEEIIPDNLDSLSRLTFYIKKKLRYAG
ncbi:MAG: acyl carrier protein [Candidatus Helarchaeota archaeon]